MIVPSRPLRVRRLSSYSHEHSNSSLLEKAIFFQRGRYALLYCLQELGVEAGDTVVVPAYYCESALQPLRAYGYKFEFVDIASDLNIQSSSIENIVSGHRVKALLLTHYFGFEQAHRNAIHALCKANGVVLVEDYSHSFLSYLHGAVQRSNIDACIFSLAKSIPVLFGGAVVINNAEKEPIGFPLAAPTYGEYKFMFLRVIERMVVQAGWPNIYAPIITRIKQSFTTSANTHVDSDPGDPEACKRIPPSYLLNCYLMDTDTLDAISATRVGNYQKLVKILTALDITTVIPNIDAGEIPQILPVSDPSGRLLDFLRDRGVGAYQWPGDELPNEVKDCPDLFPVATSINHASVCMPIHQDIDQKHMDYLSAVMEKWSMMLTEGKQ